MIDVTCPQCSAVYHSEESHVGKRLRCARCGSLVPILSVARNIVSQPTSAPSAPQVHPASGTKTATGFKPLHKTWTAVAILLALSSVGLILHFRHTGTASVSDTVNGATKHQPSQQESHPEWTVVAEEPIPNSDKTNPLPDPRPDEYNSLPTGSRIERDVGTAGHGELNVEDGGEEDAVVRLSRTDSDETARWFFVKAHSTAHMHGIPVGSYRLTYTTGLNWLEAEDAFSWHPTYSEFERSFDFKEQRDSEGVQYKSISVTLHSVPFGNVHTKTISREEFLKGHRHIALQ